jgi:hypothetical protein
VKFPPPRLVLQRARVLLGKLGWRAWLEVALLAAIVVGAWVHARSYAGATIDDAFITFRHSWNLIHGHGLSCNAGERVEGTSSSLFALLMTGPIALGADPYDVATLIGCTAFAGCVLAAYFGVRACLQDESARVLALGAAALVAASSELAFHSQTGMETLPYACLVGAALSLQFAAVADERRAAMWASLFGVAALVRPEGFLFFLLAFAIACVARGRSPGALAKAKRELLRFGVVYVPWLAFRLLYFGKFLPNSVVAKGGHTSLLVHSDLHATFTRLVHGPGGALLDDYVRTHPLSSALLVGTFLLPQTRRAGVTAFAFALACAALLVWSDGDWMPYSRHLTSAIVPLAIGATLGLRGLFFHAEQRTRFGHLPSYALTGLALWLMLASARTRLDVEKVSFVSLDRLRAMGKHLAPFARDDDLVATEIAGILPYYWGAQTLDMLGLCDEHIARAGRPAPLGSGREDVAYVVAQRPTFYAFNLASEAARFYARPEFSSHHDEYGLLVFPYRLLAPLKALPITLFVRKDRKELDRLLSAVGGRLVEPEAELKRLGYLH